MSWLRMRVMRSAKRITNGVWVLVNTSEWQEADMSKDWRINRDLKIQRRAVEILSSASWHSYTISPTDEHFAAVRKRIEELVAPARKSVIGHAFGYFDRVRFGFGKKDGLYLVPETSTRDVATQARGIVMLNALAWEAPYYGYTEEQVLERQAQYLAATKGARISVASHLWGYYIRIRDEWYRHNLVYCHISPDNRFYTAHHDVPPWAESVDPLYKAGRGAEIATWRHAHFWKNGKRYGKIEACQPCVVKQLEMEITQ